MTSEMKPRTNKGTVTSKNKNSKTIADSGISARIRYCRELAGLTTRVAAGKIGISQGYLSALETEIRTPSAWAVLVRICEAYEVDANWLLGISSAVNDGMEAEKALIAKKIKYVREKLDILEELLSDDPTKTI